MRVIVAGDIHANWGGFNRFINKQKPDIIIQCGDFGWWPHYHRKNFDGARFNQFGIKNIHNNGNVTKIYWIAGNHENWDDLNCITDYEPLEIQDGITYCPFGTVLELNGMNILCCGGAESTDKEWRIEGVSWWKDELISQKDMDNLPDCKIDILISHTIPRYFMNYVPKFNYRHRDPSTLALQMILERYRPKYWYSGHMHHFIKKTIDDCNWTSLSMLGGEGRWWVDLP